MMATKVNSYRTVLVRVLLLFGITLWGNLMVLSNAHACANSESTEKIFKKGVYAFIQYEIGEYEGIYFSDEFNALCEKLEKENKLIKSETFIEKFKSGEGKYTFFHKITAINFKPDVQVIPEYAIYYYTDTIDSVEEFANNVKTELGYDLVWTDIDMLEPAENQTYFAIFKSNTNGYN